MTALLADKGLDKTNKLFKNQSLLDEHYGKHGQEIADVLGDSNYSIDKYLDDANYIINNGTYAPELNGYVSFMSGKKYGFVGLDRTTGDITTFHIKNISELIKKAPSLVNIICVWCYLCYKGCVAAYRIGCNLSTKAYGIVCSGFFPYCFKSVARLCNRNI